MTEEAAVATGIEAVRTRLGDPLVVVNNATGPQPFISLEQQSWEDYLGQLDFFFKAPLLLLHGEADRAVPMQQSEIILAKYRAAGASAELVKNPGPHGFWNQDPMFTETMDRAVAFFREKLK